MEEKWKYRWKAERPEKNRRGEYIGTIVWNVVALFAMNKLPDWHVNFINHNYLIVLYPLSACILVQITGNILMLALDYRLVRYLSRIVMEAATFIVLILLYYLNPFDFSTCHGLHWLDSFLPVLFILGMVFSVLRILSNTWKLFTRF